MTLEVAAAQFAAVPNKIDNRLAITDLVAAAVAQGAELVALPENAMWSHPDSTTDLAPIAEPLDGEFAGFLADLARRHGVAIICGMTERADDLGKVYNTVVAIDGTGEQVGHYRKVHLYDAFGYQESDHVVPGPIADPIVFTVGGVRVGWLTCYDLRFPESARRLVDAGAELLVLPAAWVAGPMKEDHWTTLLRARAIENTIYVLAAGQTGPVCVGQSCLIDPAGVMVASAGPVPGVITAAVDTERVAAVRKTNPALAMRRFAVVERS